MDPTTTFCPNEHCHARGQTSHGNIGIHSRKEQRFICHECDKTFSATTARSSIGCVPRQKLVIIVTLLAHGCPCKRLWRLLGLTSGRSPRSGPFRSTGAGTCTSPWSNNHVTWAGASR